MSAPDHREYRARKFFGSLDGLRTASIVGVIWHHSHDGLATTPLTERGFLGVDMFFVISGFLIVTLLLREKESRGQISLRKFYARRTLRIFPIYYTVLLVFGLLLWIGRPDGASTKSFFEALPFFLTYTSNWVHVRGVLEITWSLASEEQFYLLWPPLERFFPKIIPAFLVLFVVLNQLVNFGVLDDFLREGLGLRNDLSILQSTFTPIAFGVVLARVLHRPEGFQRLVAVGLAARWSPIILGCVLVGLCSIPGDISGLPRLSIHLAMVLFLASVVIREDHLLSSIMQWGPVRRIGIVSYGMYLYHMFARHGVDALLDKLSLRAPGLLFVSTTAVTFALSELSFRYYESPFLRFKKRFEISKREQRDTEKDTARKPPGLEIQDSEGA